MTDYRRNYVDGGTYFFIVNLAERKQKRLIEHVDILREAFRTVKKSHPFHIDAIVILPDHLHTIWTLPENDYDFSLRWRQIKSAFSRNLKKKSVFLKVDYEKKNAEYGNGDFGSIHMTRMYLLTYVFYAGSDGGIIP